MCIRDRNDAVERAVTQLDIAADGGGNSHRLIVHHSKPVGGNAAVGSAKKRKADAAEYDARAALVSASLEAVTTPAIRRRLSGKTAIAVVIGVPSPAWVKPVSYTHLDVYKRQVLIRHDRSTRELAHADPKTEIKVT